jgi:isoamylase
MAGGAGKKAAASAAAAPSAASLALTEPARPPTPPDAARADLLRFASELVGWRRGPARHLFAGREAFLGDGDVTWHERDWGNDESRFLAWTLHDTTAGAALGCGDAYIAFNAHPFLVDAPLPGPVGRWARLIDTALPAPRDFTPGGNKGGVTTGSYGVQGHSCVVLISNWREGGAGEGHSAASAA